MNWLLLFFALNAFGAQPERLITLNPAITETLFEIGAGDRIVGTVDASDHPARAAQIPRVGSYGRPNIEKIIELKPDAVLTFKEGVDQIGASLERRKIKLFVYESRTLSDFAKTLKSLEKDLGIETKSALKKWEEGLKSIKPGAQKKSVLLQLESTPLIIAGGDSFLSEILKLCGHTNAFEDIKGYPTLSNETVYTKNFDTVVVLKEKTSKKEREAIEKTWSTPQLKKVIFYESHTLSRLAPRLPDEAKKFCERISNP